MAKRRLGRGLGALLGQPSAEEPEELASADLQHVEVRQIDPNPYQPREDFRADEMAALVQSIRRHGVLQPIVVRPAGGRYQLVAGERRLRAALEAGLETLPARVLELDEKKTCEIALIENLQREDLNPLEKARAFQEYLERFGMTQEKLADSLGISRSAISNLVRLLELPEQVQEQIRSGALSAGHARALLPLGEEAEQVALARRIAAEGLSVRDVEALVGQTLRVDDAQGVPAPNRGPAKKSGPRSRHVDDLEDRLRGALGTRVEIRARGKQRGQIVVHFTSNEEFERLLDQLCGSSRVAVAG